MEMDEGKHKVYKQPGLKLCEILYIILIFLLFIILVLHTVYGWVIVEIISRGFL